MVGKVDLVMWAKNGAALLPSVFKRIDQIVPFENVCHKIIVDDSSTDGTPQIAKDFNWTVYQNPTGGIPGGANEALRHVDSDFFISFEQDVLLARNWWEKIPKYMEDPLVACAQGIRVPTRPLLRVLDEWEYGGAEKRSTQVSIDNDLFRTRIVRSLGGFPIKCPFCTDNILRQTILSETPYKWVIDPNVVSLHIRGSLKDVVDHQYKLSYMCAKTPYCSPGEKLSSLSNLLRILLTSPLRGIQIALKRDCPEIVWAYPLMRIYLINGKIKYAKTRQK